MKLWRRSLVLINNPMTTNYHEEITKLLDSAGLIDKTLSKGCEIKEWPFSWISTYLGKQEESRYHCYFFPKEQTSFLTDEIEKFEILGHPWDLREVMAWFEKQKLWEYTGIELIGNCLCKTFADGYWYKREKLVEFDLSKPLSQQDLKPLYELMKSISDNK